MLAGTEGARWPFTSPDGAWIGFFRDAKIYKVSQDGGDPLVVCDVRGGPGATWTADRRIVFSRTWLSGLSIVSADGGTPTVLTTPDPKQQEIGHWWPSVLPDGHILFTVVTAGTGLNDARIALLDPASGSYRDAVSGSEGVVDSVGPHPVLPHRALSRGAVRPVVVDGHRRIVSRARPTRRTSTLRATGRSRSRRRPAAR